jgi:hydroxyacylglutathione hydrolase
LTIEQLAELMGLQPGMQIIDVRNPGETAEGVLPGAQVIPLPVLVDSFDRISRDAPVVTYCAGGYRSLIAASALEHAGFTDVSDLLGGASAWTGAGLPVSSGRPDGGKPVPEVDPIDADAMVEAGAVLIDVREPEEWSAGHAPDARLIPMSQVEGRLSELTGSAKTLVVCRTGGRSAAITELLTSRGLEAANLAGGMRAWSDAGLPVVTDAGEPGRII